jgi:hypothetical protein
MIIANLTQNAKMAQAIIATAVDALPFERTCECANALKFALNHPSRCGAGQNPGRSGAESSDAISLPATSRTTE